LPEELQIRVHGDAPLPTLVYLPGLHGDWTLITGFRAALKDRVRFVEITYPRTLTWTVDDYATAIEQALLARGIHHGWVLGESFGSQPAWPLLAAASFKADGLILAAGFVKHPLPYAPLILRSIGNWRPYNFYLLSMKVFALYRPLCHRLTPEARADLKEFVARRTPLDRQAMGCRLRLIHQYDPRPIARQTRIPVFYLASLVDPLVPWLHVRRWLRKNCPGYRGGKTIWLADHTLLASSPIASSTQVLRWMNVGAQPRLL
jgi:pimeloyl-ACP methyl ester carboxylesterase